MGVTAGRRHGERLRRCTTISSDTGGRPSRAPGRTPREREPPPPTSDGTRRLPGHSVRRPRSGQQRLVQPRRSRSRSRARTTCPACGCSTTATYSGPDTGHTAVAGSCSDNAGNSGRRDSSSSTTQRRRPSRRSPSGDPTRTVGTTTESRSRSWARTPVRLVGSCAEPVQYKGPDAPKASVSGTCTDKAANTSPPASYDLRLDTKPPVLGRMKAEVTSRGVVLKWTTSKDTHAIAVVRRPGMSGRKLSTIYNGKARTFTDRRLKTGLKYRYTITAYDEAGNAAVKGLAHKAEPLDDEAPVTKPAVAKPAAKPSLTRPALTGPAAGARLTVPPLLAWGAVARASYYNVQLYRNGRKVLTVWPRRRPFSLQRTWRFDGRTYELTPGTYRWYVWPGFGARSANRYGKLLGTRELRRHPARCRGQSSHPPARSKWAPPLSRFGRPSASGAVRCGPGSASSPDASSTHEADRAWTLPLRIPGLEVLLGMPSFHLRPGSLVKNTPGIVRFWSTGAGTAPNTMRECRSSRLLPLVCPGRAERVARRGGPPRCRGPLHPLHPLAASAPRDF